MSFLNLLTKEKIANDPLPLADLLTNSLYYPSSGWDGGVIKDCNTQSRNLDILSFIYCDYAVGKDAFLQHQNDFLGYHILGSRSLLQEELVPNGWNMKIPHDLDLTRYRQYQHSWKPFGHWTVYERDKDRPDTHGPNRFSLIYLGGEGVATYQALYWSNLATPRVLCIIQSGEGFGLNWTDFREEDKPLGWVVNNNPHGKPGYLYYGGYGGPYTECPWSGFECVHSIHPYYHDEFLRGTVRLWKRVINTRL